jgi:hypothetical protein
MSSTTPPCPFSDERLADVVSKVPPPERGERLISSADAIRLNYFPDEWASIFADAQQKNYRTYSARRAVPTANIINDFFDHTHFAGRRVLELGPGHYTFAIIARHLGAQVVCAERDPALVRLGRHLGFDVIDADFLEPDFPRGAMEHAGGRFDGVWLRGVLNACAFPDEDALRRHVRALHELLTPAAWGWSTSSNVATTGEEAQSTDGSFADRRIEAQRRAFEGLGWCGRPVTDEMRARFRLNFKGCRYIFTRKLDGGER